LANAKLLETFENPYPDRDYDIFIEAQEFTSLCPRTGHPDFGTIQIRYIPDRTCLELKALKLYLQGYRNEGVFYERLTNAILDDLVNACRPRWMQIKGLFRARGGITTTVTAEYRRPDHASSADHLP